MVEGTVSEREERHSRLQQNTGKREMLLVGRYGTENGKIEELTDSLLKCL